jgi:hypothetical protein
LGVFSAIFALLILAWGFFFVAHIGHEEIIIRNIDVRVKEMSQTPSSGLGEMALESQMQELATLMALDSAARKSMYDPFWFLDNAP